RANIILPPCSMIGPVVTIRKFSDKIRVVEDLIKLEELDTNIATFLIGAMKAKLNVVFCGSTGAGKTTLMNVFSTHIPEGERIITIEDTAELKLHQKHVVSLCSKSANVEGKGEISMRDLFVNSLRMRPDRIIVGELRGGEALDMIQAIISGHSGSLAIVHAETPEDCFNRLVTMMIMTGIPITTKEFQAQIAKAVDVIIHVELFMDGKRRVTCITDISLDEKTKEIKMRDMFKFVEKSITADGQIIGEWEFDRKKPSFYYKFEKRRVSLPKGFFEE
ncbi:MAG: Flp pilus assembly complex ATPase component TadA, partial [Candidatus Omnitrophica bacterium]|nr:Flp pilus assembly complex ATPase component TadA [Candidatus Omnitrophota bacterium]